VNFPKPLQTFSGAAPCGRAYDSGARKGVAMTAYFTSFSKRGALILGLAALSTFVSPARADDMPNTPPSGHVEIEEMQVAFIGSGTLGGGKLIFEGRTHPFNVGGLGVGGFGASKFTASGDVYNLKKLSDFAGPYAEIRTGWALGDNGKGRTWLRNANGVVLSLKGAREGLQMATGASGVVIQFK
jgi:hypothetical protein